ncbi:MAG: hypothetical protein OWV35_04895 [Firmicutes bacterium]|nr:hypothetical protein [Bacillota bacterium]
MDVALRIAGVAVGLPVAILAMAQITQRVPEKWVHAAPSAVLMGELVTGFIVVLSAWSFAPDLLLPFR